MNRNLNSQNIINHIALSFYSAHFQDWVISSIYEFSGNSLNEKVFIEVATNEPIRHSNSYVFEKCNGWQGICVEPNPAYHRAIRKHRRCALETYCISDSAKEVTFEHREGASRMVDGIIKTSKFKSFSVECVTLEKLLEKHNYSHVHYFSLDVERHEYAVLKTIDWNRRHFDLISVEGPTQEVISLLQKNNMHQILCIGPDGLFSSEPMIEPIKRWYNTIGEKLLPQCISTDTKLCLSGNDELEKSCGHFYKEVLKLRGGKKNKLVQLSDIP